MAEITVDYARPGDVTDILEMGMGDPANEVSKSIRFYEANEMLEWTCDRENNIFLVAKLHDRVIGYAFCKMISWVWAYLDSLYVIPSHRRFGAGTKLLESLDLILKVAKVEYVSTCVEWGKIHNEAFLAKHGFKTQKTYKWMDKEMHDQK